MPRTKPKPEEVLVQAPSSEVLTLTEAAAYLKLSEAEVLRGVEEQALPARRRGNEWRFLKSAIQQWLRTGSPSKSNKEAWMELAGAWKDDLGLPPPEK